MSIHFHPFGMSTIWVQLLMEFKIPSDEVHCLFAQQMFQQKKDLISSWIQVRSYFVKISPKNNFLVFCIKRQTNLQFVIWHLELFVTDDIYIHIHIYKKIYWYGPLFYTYGIHSHELTICLVSFIWWMSRRIAST